MMVPVLPLRVQRRTRTPAVVVVAAAVASRIPGTGLRHTQPHCILGSFAAVVVAAEFAGVVVVATAVVDRIHHHTLAVVEQQHRLVVVQQRRRPAAAIRLHIRTLQQLRTVYRKRPVVAAREVLHPRTGGLDLPG